MVMEYLPELVLLCVALVAMFAEGLHLLRVRRAASLAFGPAGQPSLWARFAPLLRVAGLAALAWGLTTLYLLPPKTHKLGTISPSEYRHLLLLLDVSPSMRLEDAGPTLKEARKKRAADLLQSFFERVPMERYKTTVVAFYTDAKPVVVETSDLEIVRTILTDLPMSHAFKAGPTEILAGIKEACKIAQPWQPQSTILLIVTDGDTVPPTGMPRLPASINHVVVAGVGDTAVGKFIAGHQSRQDISSLRQVAARLKGTYHNGNEKHLATDLLKEITAREGETVFEKLTKREYALIAVGAGGTLLALLPLLLHLTGTPWRPGVRVKRSRLEVSTAAHSGYTDDSSIQTTRPLLVDR
jgi:Ca-activated chloride channel family protein